MHILTRHLFKIAHGKAWFVSCDGQHHCRYLLMNNKSRALRLPGGCHFRTKGPSEPSELEVTGVPYWHDDVIKWKDFPRYWTFVRGIHRSPVNSLHKGQRRRALMFSLICTWINGWVNNGEASETLSLPLWHHCNDWWQWQHRQHRLYNSLWPSDVIW